MLLSGEVFARKQVAKNDKEVPSPITVNRLLLKGEIIDDDNISFFMKFEAESDQAADVLIAGGEICEKNDALKNTSGGFFFWLGSDNFSTYSRKGLYFLQCNKPGKCEVNFDFFSRVRTEGEWRDTEFYLIPAIAREVEIYSKRKDIELEIPGALKLIKKDAPNNIGTIFHAALPPEGNFQIKWRSHVEKLDSKLVVSVSPVIVSETLPGTVRNYSTFNYSIIQGKLSSLDLEISPDLNILNVKGDDIQDWKVEKTDKGRFLRISLSREFDKSYQLNVTSEKVLPDFPCKFSLPKILPQNVLRVDGYLSFGTNKAVKLIIDKVSGLSQVDTRAFPIKQAPCPIPKRSVYTYRFSGNEYSLETNADNIMPSYTVDLNHIVNFKDEDMLVTAMCSLDIKDAPLRELMVKYPKDLTVNRVEGRDVKPDDYELVTKNGEKWVKVPFKENTMGKVDVVLNFEKNIGAGKNLELPLVFIDKAKSVRGYLLLAAARGLSLKAEDLKNLRKIHPGSVPFRFPGVQLSYKFKGQDWSGKVSATREKTSFVSEIFHLSTVGEGAIYGITIFNYRISGAPVDKITLAFGKGLKNPEFTGGGIVDWKKVREDENNQYWQVNFREKLFGEYKLLATYEQPRTSDEKTDYIFGNVFTEGAEGENGFIVISSKLNLKITDRKTADSVLPIETSELPEVYTSMVQNPIQKAFKFYKAPHWISVGITGYKSKKLIGTAVDYTMLHTRIDGNGEIVTKVNYRIKNSSNQFLSIGLPENAELWSVKVDGKIKRVSSSKTEKNNFLIPIPRKKDTDETIAVDLEYAQKIGKALGSSREIPLRAPELNVDTMGAAWKVEIPENYNFTAFNGNMMTKRSPQISGLSGIYTMTKSWAKMWIRGRGKLPFGILTPLFVIFVSGAVIAWSFGKKKLRIFMSVLGAVGLIIGLVLTIYCISGIYFPRLNPPSVNSAEFTKLFSLPQDTPSIDLSIDDMESTSFMNVFLAFVALILSGVCFVFGKIRKNILLYGLGTTLLLAGFAQWLAFNTFIAFMLPIVMSIGLLVLLWLYVFKRARRSIVAFAMLLMAFLPFSSLHAAENNVVVDSAVYDITASDKEVKTVGHFEVTAKEAGEVLIVPAPAAITGNVPEDSDIKIERREKNYFLKVKSAGTYKFDLELLLPLIKEKNGVFSFPLPLPECKKDIANIVVDQKNIDIKALNAVSFKSGNVNGNVSATATFVPGTAGMLRLYPQKRNVKQEELQFFANIDGFANFAGGFVEIVYAVGCHVAQGEVATFAIEVPDNMGITSVTAPDLGAWRYSPETDLLEIFLTQPHHDDLKMQITAQIANCTLPYQKEIAMLKIRGAGKQHGTLGISSDPSVQLQMEKPEGLNPINTDDFSQAFQSQKQLLKKAYRYFKTPAKVTVSAIPVEPELRIDEKCEISFEEEKTTMFCDLAVETTKAGIFSVKINIPKDFDIDQVTGPAIRHWDEISEKDKHQVIVHFDRRMLGTTSIHLRMMTEKEIPKELVIPRIFVEKVSKHKGELVIKLERGTRMEAKERRGLEVAASSGFRKPGQDAAQRFSIIRPDWMLKVEFDKASPWIQVENLQVAKITDGTLDMNAYFNYKIENAGVKHFLVKLPKTAEIPEFKGKDILYRQELEDGVWDIELRKKENAAYRLHIKFRSPIENVKKLIITPVKAVGVGLQKGFLVVMTEDSFQIKEDGKKGELTQYDARKIPSTFKQENLSNAILSYRSVGTDYSLELQLARHKAAKLLRANINKVDLASVVSQEGNIITRMLINLTNIGNENFLKVKLPGDSSIWSVFIDRFPEQFNPGQAVDVAAENGEILIPLKQKNKTSQLIEVIYSLPASKNWRLSSQLYNGPEFDLPLNNVTWDLYLPEEFNYDDFSGSLDYVGRDHIPIPVFSMSEYDAMTQQKKVGKKNIARQWLFKANKLSKTGNRQEANDAFRNAANYALNDQELNEDIQGQWVASQRDNTMDLFANRAPQQIMQIKPANSALVIPEQKREFGAKERQTITSISDKIFHQQQAAAAEAQPLIFSIPEQGKKIQFSRRLQMERNIPMQVKFDAAPAFSWKKQSNIWAGIMLTLIFSLFFVLARTVIKKKAVPTDAE